MWMNFIIIGNLTLATFTIGCGRIIFSKINIFKLCNWPDIIHLMTIGSVQCAPETNKTAKRAKFSGDFHSILHAVAVSIIRQGWLTPAEKHCRQINAQKYGNGTCIATPTSTGRLTNARQISLVSVFNDKSPGHLHCGCDCAAHYEMHTKQISGACE